MFALSTESIACVTVKDRKHNVSLVQACSNIISQIEHSELDLNIRAGGMEQSAAETISFDAFCMSNLLYLNCAIH